MNLAITLSRAQHGISAPLVRVEVHISSGLPTLSIVGLPTTAVRESKDRVRSAIQNSHFEYPPGRITINLSPADLPKDGGRFDLPIAIGILAASGQVPTKGLEKIEFVGELALTGEIRDVVGTFSAALHATQSGHTIFVPPTNAAEAALAPGATVLTAPNLLQISAHLHGNDILPPTAPTLDLPDPCFPDFSDIRGQLAAKRALEVAAAGNHNILMIGPPGTGKSMMAARVPGILPPPEPHETLEILAIHSACTQRAPISARTQRPFRNPHHSASAASMVGGGSNPRPGEISMAHGGVLFLDEIAEFPRAVLEGLRGPLESGEVIISRVHNRVSFPARFQLIAAMNPCPCGYDGDHQHRCRCTPDQIHRYRDKLSGPLLDRIDIQIQVPRISASVLADLAPPSEGTLEVASRVALARNIQLGRAGKPNAILTSTELERDCQLTPAQRGALLKAIDKLGLSARAYHRLLKVARSIADLDNRKDIEDIHINEALGYRTCGIHARA
ncbi:MAG: magnesium chelatase family protein [Halieaceae bacterium]|jgi:magnesium chelatase family protein